MIFKHHLISRIILRSIHFLEDFAAPIILLIIRLWMARIFWYSGLVKISDWQSTLALFQYEYKVPLINPELAAYLAALTELTCPILLTLGIATRFATIPMLIMTIVIQFTYLDSSEHFYWAMLLATILCFGPGKISLDYWVRKRIAMPAK
ncbi:MAG: DoxX family protein [Gammaproteobacteria bacterium]